ncbi:hypothetical protein NHJ13051_009498 [Beauveria bassiana]
MPRPKVHPSQRKRAAEACNFCRMSKKKCSATVPCTACQRRGIGHTCYLTHSPRASRSTAHRVQASLGDGSPATDALSAGRRASGAETVWLPGDSARCWVPPEPVIPLDPDTYQPISPSDSRAAATDTNNMESDTSPLLHTAQRESRALGRESHARMLLNLRGERGKPGVLFVSRKLELTRS